jgi:hypothetical protein
MHIDNKNADALATFWRAFAHSRIMSPYLLWLYPPIERTQFFYFHLVLIVQIFWRLLHGLYSRFILFKVASQVTP